MDAYIKEIAFYLPEKVVTNEDLQSDFPDWCIDKIYSKIGIKQRHIAADGETALDMAEKAAKKLLASGNVDVGSIDFVLFCTQSPDYFLPTSACILQDRLGVKTSAGALDFNLGCSGYIYGLSLAKGLLSAGVASNILFLTSETYSKYIKHGDRSAQTIFGDAATASLVTTDGFAKIGDFVLGSNGAGAKFLIVEKGGSRFPCRSNSDASGDLFMSGMDVFNFTMETVPGLVADTLIKNNMVLNDVDLFVFHQANKFMLNTLRKLCGIAEDKMFFCLENYANTVSSTIPIALKDALSTGAIIKNDKILTVGFGVGLSWGGVVLHF